ncbi:MAG TPA: ATP-binding cassette domain-containing protein, partial [Flexilinea sp.]|nr:ATP-binding cassette domain-containing protein [Flexilinea sp.]
METGESKKLLSIRGITKAFGQNLVLKGVDMDLCGGEILALIGGNGAGKSTLMKIIMGIYQPDAGCIFINGKEVQIINPSVALEECVYMVPQEPMLFPNMSVFENIIMGFHESNATLKARLQEIMADIGWQMDLTRKAITLSIAEQTLVEILRGLMRNAKILILDEPTSALTFDEVESFFRVVKELKNKGIGIIYITHRLNEVFEIASHVMIMRDGVITLGG